MIATRGFVRTPQFSRARLSHFPTDAEALRGGHPRIQLVQDCVLVYHDYRIPCSDCSSFDFRISLLNPTDVKTCVRPLDCTLLRPSDRSRVKVSLSCPYPNASFASTVSCG